LSSRTPVFFPCPPHLSLSVFQGVLSHTRKRILYRPFFLRLNSGPLPPFFWRFFLPPILLFLSVSLPPAFLIALRGGAVSFFSFRRFASRFFSPAFSGYKINIFSMRAPLAVPLRCPTIFVVPRFPPSPCLPFPK